MGCSIDWDYARRLKLTQLDISQRFTAKLTELFGIAGRMRDYSEILDQIPIVLAR